MIKEKLEQLIVVCCFMVVGCQVLTVELFDGNV